MPSASSMQKEGGHWAVGILIANNASGRACGTRGAAGPAYNRGLLEDQMKEYVERYDY